MVLIVLVLGAYAGWFIYRSSFVVEGKRYFCLFDDAMVSMRYAANWAAGNGLVWQAGERVEGFSNPLWTMLMGVVHLLPVSIRHTSLVVQVIGVAVLWGCLGATLRLGRSVGLSPSCRLLAGGLFVGQWNLLFFTLAGMETGLYALLITLALASCADALRRGEARVGPMAWLAVAAWVRPDAAIVIATTVVFMLVACRNRRRMAMGVLLIVGVIGLQTIWRRYYYGAWMPNTYYLKATGWPLVDRLPVGLHTGVWTLAALGVPIGLAMVSVVVRLDWWRAYLATTLIATLAYEIYVGGDAWPKHYRFVVPVSAGLMVLAVDAMSVIARQAWTRRAGLMTAFMACVVLASTNSLHWRNWLLLDRPIATLANRTSVRYAVGLDRIADPSATAAVAWAGAFPYFSGRTCFDMLGKCDAHIARLAAGDTIRVAGHNKFDPRYTISTYHPDVLVDCIRLLRPDQLEAFYPVVVEVDGARLMFSVRKGTHRVHGGRRIDWQRAWEVFEATPRS